MSDIVIFEADAQQVEFFNLDAIISVGYRVNSSQSTGVLWENTYSWPIQNLSFGRQNSYTWPL